MPPPLSYLEWLRGRLLHLLSVGREVTEELDVQRPIAIHGEKAAICDREVVVVCIRISARTFRSALSGRYDQWRAALEIADDAQALADLLESGVDAATFLTAWNAFESSEIVQDVNSALDKTISVYD